MDTRLMLSPSQFQNILDGQDYLWPRKTPRLKLVPNVGEDLLQLKLQDYHFGVVTILGLEFRIPDGSYCVLGSSIGSQRLYIVRRSDLIRVEMATRVAVPYLCA